MRKRLLSVLLCLCMVTSLLPAGAVRAMAVGPQNRYGHSIIYTPVESLRLNGRNISLVDASTRTVYDEILKGRNDRQQVEYLTRKGYNLNWFLTLNKQKTLGAYLDSFRPVSVEWRGGLPRLVYGEPNLSDHFEGWIDIHDQTTSRYWVHYDADPALYTPVVDGRNNIYNMVGKGDVEYIFPYKTQTVDAAFGSEDTCAVEILGKKKEYSGKGGHNWGYYSRTGLMIDAKSWYKPSHTLRSGLHFYGHSNWDDENDAYMHSGVLVGRDAAGPKIRSVTLTRDPAGKEPIRGAIGMDLVDSLRDRTIYFQVEWDEPVKFRSGVTLADLAKLELKIQTSGKDNGSAMPMSAPFYSFAPGTMDGTPVMTFEYRIMDPYDESSPDLELAKKRGDYYTIKRLEINAAENKELFDNVVDLSNNPVGCDRNGYREEGLKIACDVSGSPYVDLRPLVITGVRVEKPHDWEHFVGKGELLTIALDFNKPIDINVFADGSGNRDPENKPERVPVMTLNLLDKDGRPVVIRAGTGVTYPRMEYRDGAWVQKKDEHKNPVFHTFCNSSFRWVPMTPVYQAYSWRGGGARTLRYSLPFYPDAEHQYRLPEGETSIRVVSIDAVPGGILDEAGYSLPSYKLDRASGTLLPVVSELPAPVQGYVNAHQDQANKPYQVSLDRQYRLDFDDPVVEPELYMADVQNRIVGIRANITDRNLAGCSVNYCISFQGEYEGKIQYQSAASENWTENWVDAEVGGYGGESNVVSFSGGITPTPTGGIANGFVKLPETVEFANVKATLTVSDEANNTGIGVATKEGAFLDNVAPRIHGAYENSQRLSAEEVITAAEVRVEEYSAYRSLSYAWAKPGEPEPAESAYKPAPLPTPGKYWGMYSHIPGPTKEDIGNRIDTRTLWFKAADEHGNSRTYHEDLSFDCRTPEIKVTFEGNVAHLALQHPDAKYFWWGVLEKPANYVADGVDYRDPVSYIKALGLDQKMVRYYTTGRDQIAGERRPGSSSESPLAPNGGITYRDYTIKRAARTSSYAESAGVSEPFGDSERLKWANGGNMSLDVTTNRHRPLLLVVGANGYDNENFEAINNYELEVFEIPTIGQEQPEIKARQVRFSSNDRDGVRQDHIRTGLKDDIGQGLVWADDPTHERTDYPQVLNVPALHDFAEAEFYLAGDPVTGLAGLDLQKSQIRLDRVVRGGGWALFSGTSDSAKWNHDGEGNRELLQKWSLQSVGLDQITQGSMEEFQNGMTKIGGQKICADNAPLYSFVLSLDPNMFSTTVLHQRQDDEDAEVVLYEFSFLPVYADGTQGSGESVTFFAFENDPAVSVELNEFKYTEEGYGGGLNGYPDHDTQLVLDEQGRDITENVPVCNICLPEDGTTSFFPVFEVLGAMDSAYMLFNSSPNQGKLGVDPLVRWGTDPAHLDKVSRTTFYKSGPTTTTDSVNLAAGETLRLYYQAEDAIKGGKQPIYVVDVYRDAIPPVAEFKASELDRKVQEVTFRLDTAYDGHWVGEGEDRRFVVDTPSEELLEELGGYTIRAERFLLPDEPGDPDYPTDDPDYPPQTVDVLPDENGVYHFKANGTISVYAEHITDRAGNSMELLINGKPFPQNEWGGYKLEITNVDTLPPNLVTAPQYTVDKATGSFTVTAKVDDPTASAYLRFDDAYTTFLTGIEAPADPSLFPDTYRLVSLDSGPGVMKKDPVTVPDPEGGTMEVIPGAVDENGNISAKVYMKYGEKAPAAASVTLVVRDSAGHQAESKPFTLDLAGVKPVITNAPSANSGTLPAYEYGKSLDTNVPVSIPELDLPLGTSHRDLPLYGDGPVNVTAEDLFGTEYAFRFYGDIFGPAYRHRITFQTADGKDILPTEATNQNVTVTIDTSATPGLMVNGKQTFSQKFTANGTLDYRLSALGLGEKAFQTQVNCIDKTAPEATVSVKRDGPSEDVSKAYSVTCTVESFSEPDVTLLPDADGTVSRSVTFNKNSANSTHTFRFQDKAGNIGTCTVSAADYQFVEQTDRTIALYRLTYTKNSPSGANELFTVTMDAGSDSKDYPLPALLANTDISVRVEAMNAAGQVIPCTMTEESKTGGTLVFPEMKNIVFGGESPEDREAAVKLKSDRNEIRFRVRLPGGSIDTTAPTGTISFVTEGDLRKVYLNTLDTDLAQNGVAVQGQQVDGKQLALEQDAEGSCFVTLDLNGRGRFLLRDKAGNTGSVSFAVMDIDKEPPYVQHEAWSGAMEAQAGQLAELLSTPTNNSIFAFFTFNEQLSRVDATAYDRQNGRVLEPQSDYVGIVASGNTLTVEFKQNCQVHLVAYDLKGNSYELWRPEDGPITVIDKAAPELAGEPQVRVEQNKVTITYAFANGEDVTLTNSVGDHAAGLQPVYQNQHTVTFDKNGQYTLTFADRAGNVLSVHPVVDQIDELAPEISMAMDVADKAHSGGGVDSTGKPYYYTSGDVYLYLNVQDASGVGSVTAQRMSGIGIVGSPVPVEKGRFTLENVQSETGVSSSTFNYRVTVEENGVYEIVAADRWGHSTTIRPSVNSIDRTAPAIGFQDSRPVFVPLNSTQADVESAVMQGVTVSDLQSGKGSVGKDKKPAVTLSVDLSGVDLAARGTYQAVITARDLLGNTSTRTRAVVVTEDGFRSFRINGVVYAMNDICSLGKGETIEVELDQGGSPKESISYYWAKGHLTIAQMKYADSLTGPLTLTEEGYYTILAQSAERGMYVVYVYAY